MEKIKDRRQIYPLYSKQRINNCAKNISRDLNQHHGICSAEDEKVVENWRASHTHIINTWQVILRRRIKGKKICFAQRQKRKNTIYDKLKRFPGMQLTRMHDIAGCRLIFRKEEDMMNYIHLLHSSTALQHTRKKEQYKDYVQNPKESGYRGIHDVYAYKSKKGTDRSNKWDGLLIEIQYRTIYQHAWATAVEIADYLTNSRTKFSQGNKKQQEFFKYASEIIARAYENKTSCKHFLTNRELISGFKRLENDTHLLQRLKQLKILSKIPQIFKHNLIIHFMMKNGEPYSELEGFNSLSKANSRYFELEKLYPKDDIVLVKSSDKKSIMEAYKNYFADAKDFTGFIEEGIEKLSASLKRKLIITFSFLKGLLQRKQKGK